METYWVGKKSQPATGFAAKVQLPAARDSSCTQPAWQPDPVTPYPADTAFPSFNGAEIRESVQLLQSADLLRTVDSTDLLRSLDSLRPEAHPQDIVTAALTPSPAASDEAILPSQRTEPLRPVDYSITMTSLGPMDPLTTVEPLPFPTSLALEPLVLSTSDDTRVRTGVYYFDPRKSSKNMNNLKKDRDHSPASAESLPASTPEVISPLPASLRVPSAPSPASQSPGISADVLTVADAIALAKPWLRPASYAAEHARQLAQRDAHLAGGPRHESLLRGEDNVGAAGAQRPMGVRRREEAVQELPLGSTTVTEAQTRSDQAVATAANFPRWADIVDGVQHSLVNGGIHIFGGASIKSDGIVGQSDVEAIGEEVGRRDGEVDVNRRNFRPSLDRRPAGLRVHTESVDDVRGWDSLHAAAAREESPLVRDPVGLNMTVTVTVSATELLP